MSTLESLATNPVYAFYLKLASTFLVLIGFIVFKRFFHRLILKPFSSKSRNLPAILGEAKETIEKPLDVLWLITGVYFAILVSPFVSGMSNPQPTLHLTAALEVSLAFIPVKIVHSCYSASVIALVGWSLHSFVDIYEQVLLGIASRFTLFDNTLIIRFTNNILKAIILISAVLLMLHQFFNLTSFVASIGILGAAFTFIAKDTLTNIMSGIVLMIDKPFTIGDWIQLSDLEGIVEDVSFRSTRIRTFDQGVVIVPNTTLSNDNILNWSSMPKRRHRFALGVTYSTSPESIHTFIDAIKANLSTIEGIEKDSILVYFDSFGDFSLNIMVQYYTFKTDLKSFCAVKDNVNTMLLTLSHEQNVSIAFPTQTVVVEQASV